MNIAGDPLGRPMRQAFPIMRNAQVFASSARLCAAMRDAGVRGVPKICIVTVRINDGAGVDDEGPLLDHDAAAGAIDAHTQATQVGISRSWPKLATGIGFLMRASIHVAPRSRLRAPRRGD